MNRDAASERQVRASDPAASTWVAANAGSGKTRVLTDRVARLLLAGVDPQNILCLTYTKAAASEMQNRLFRRLGDWAMRPAPELAAELKALGEERELNEAALAAARRLFARAIETPGGLRIQTIHAFCAGLLRRFPLEAGISPLFVEMEERAAELLRRETVDGMALDPETAPLVAGVADLLTGEIDPLLAEICRRAGLFDRPSCPDDVGARMGLPPGAGPEDALDIAFLGDEEQLAAEVADCCAGQSATYCDFAADLQAIDLAAPRLADLDRLADLFLYKSGDEEGRSKSGNFPQSKHKRAVAALAPVLPRLHAFMDRVEAAQRHRRACAVRDRSLALADFARAFLIRYAARKRDRGALDFDDLIAKARDLLADPAIAPWVLWRLDGGIEHILIDESQDTSPGQWAVIRALAEEFGAGQGAHPDRRRTIFAVGDKKQSIYSFQGADPDEFDRMSSHFRDRLEGVGEQLLSVGLEYSFRSAAEILRIVDAVFARDPTGLGDPPAHLAFRSTLPGRVDLWPPVPAAKKPEPPPWHRPVDAPSPEDPSVVLAGRIADEIVRMKREEWVPIWTEGKVERRRVTEGDILILVQRRSPLFQQVIRACKAKGLEVAGADRLTLGRELAVRDIVAVLRFLALPEDDLSLAAALKSPLFGWDEQALFTLARDRKKGEYLWRRLREAEGHDETLAILKDLRTQADFQRPFDLIERLLIRHDGRRRLLARLGPEAEDGIDQLLAQALAYEGQGAPGLTGFLEWIETEDVEIKRQVDAGSNQIRVMTVHGAKGLEAPIVILPDTAKRKPESSDRIYDLGGVPVWAPRKADMPPEVLAHRETLVAAEIRERRRLLYVAMTRAESWLIVCGAGDVGQGGDSWHGLVADGMAEGPSVPHRFPTGEGLRYARPDWDALPEAPAPARPEATVAAPSFPPVAPAETVRTLSPSDLGGAKVLPGDPAGGDLEASLARGTALHLLLEHLPRAAPAVRERLGLALLAGLDETAFVDDPATLVADAIRLVGTPALHEILGPESIAEAPVAGPAPGGLRLAGVIDRLLVTPDRVVAVDIKTNRRVPERPEEVPEGILRQLGAYRHLLIAIYPERTVEVAVLWTATATMMPLTPDLVTAAFSRATLGLTGR